MWRDVSEAVGGRATRGVATVVAALALLAPPPALAQQSDQWEVTVAPLYFWASELDGRTTVGSTTVPVFLEFADAVDNLGGSFSFHFEARKGRWGVLSDLFFIRLSSESTFTIPAATPTSADLTIDGDFDLDNTVFELGASYLVSEPARFAVIGGLRTYSLSPKLEFSTSAVQIAPIDVSRTSANVFGGFTYRPQLSEKISFVSRGDIGGGSAEFTWSGMLGIEYRFRPWGGLVLGYKALGIDTGGGDDDQVVTEYDVTHYGPIFGLNLHLGRR